MFIFGHYADYSRNRSTTVPEPPNSADIQEFTVLIFNQAHVRILPLLDLTVRLKLRTVIFAIRLSVYSTLCTLTNTVETIELWSASVVWLNLYALVCRLYAEEGDSTHLFSWREWVRYVECRKAVVAAHHLPTKTAVYRNTVPHDPQLFVQHYAQTNVMDLKQTGKYNDEFLMSN